MPNDQSMDAAAASGARGEESRGDRVTGRRSFNPVTIHYSALVLSFALILVLGRNQWFFGDDWAILVPRADSDIFLPHVGHWTLTPSVVFQLVRDWLGLGSYLPFLALAVVAHLAVAHLIWRILGRVGVDRWLATVLSILVMLLGGASENIFWAFQFGFMGAIALGLWVLLLFDRTTLNVPLILVLSVLAPTFSGTAIPVLAAAAVVGFIRHGWWRTVLLLLPTAISYVTWYLLVARDHPVPSSGIVSLGGALLYAAAMYGAGLGRALPWIGLGVIPALTTAIWFFATIRRGLKSVAAPAYAMVIGSVVFVALTTYSRMSFGLSGAAAERYAYLTVVLLLPAIGLQLTRLVRASKRAFIATVAVLGAFIAVNTVVLGVEAHAQAVIETGSELRVDTRLRALIADPKDAALLNSPPDAKWSPDLLGSDLLTLYRRGEIPRP
jgi:hypothetical protein